MSNTLVIQWSRLGDILEISDALMVARGDLGVELPLERVPGVQKRMCSRRSITHN